MKPQESASDCRAVCVAKAQELGYTSSFCCTYKYRTKSNCRMGEDGATSYSDNDDWNVFIYETAVDELDSGAAASTATLERN